MEYVVSFLFVVVPFTVLGLLLYFDHKEAMKRLEIIRLKTEKELRNGKD